MKYTSLALLAAAGILAGCGGGGATSPFNPAGNSGYFRFVNGSADAGSVDVYVDGQKIASGGYGYISAYNKFSPGSHTIAIDQAGTTTPVTGISTSSLSQSVNGGQYVSLVLVGEEHPTVPSDTPNLVAYSDQVYSTPNGGFAVNIHDAAPVTGTATTQFAVTSSSATQNLGSALAVGGLTQPTGVPSTFVGNNTPVSFTATVSPSTTASDTLTPSQIDNTSTGCAANTLPCNSGNLSLYFIDGPAASTTPSTTTLPNGSISSTSTTALVGIFDANGS